MKWWSELKVKCRSSKTRKVPTDSRSVVCCPLPVMEKAVGVMGPQWSFEVSRFGNGIVFRDGTWDAGGTRVLSGR